MSHLLAAEFIKMRRRIMPRIVILISLALMALLFWGIGTSSDRVNVIAPRAWISGLYLSSLFAPFVWPILGGSWAGNEYNWGTIRMILSRRPSRTQFVLAGLLILLAILAVTLVLTLIVATVAGAVVALLTQNSVFTTAGLQANYPIVVIKVFLAAFYVLAFFVVLAFTVATVFRSSAVGIGAGIGLTVVQLIATGILEHLGGVWKAIAEHFPLVYLNGLLSQVASEGTTSGFASSSGGPGVGECLLGVTIYVAILLAVTFYLVRSRDVTS